MPERPPENLASALAERFSLPIADAEPVRGLGDECEIWRTGGHAVRVSPTFRSTDDLEWVYRTVARLAEFVPEVVVPLRDADGRAVIEVAGNPVSVWPWIDGQQLDREDPTARRQAADLLARLHTAASALSDPGPRPQPVARCESCGHWDDLQDPTLDAALAAVRRRPTRMPLHGDFYRRNLIRRDGAIAGLIDWDELRIHLPESELAWATWEHSKNTTGDTLLPDRARDFLTAYEHRTGRPVDRDLIVPLIRDGLRLEICRARATHTADDTYTAGQLHAFRELRDTAL
ncbi:phosphotransferase enzyme family protein [Glycomyces paridis]|uniref:Aminoglycoside phosphotransferase domain-containing protein n=1 Tax=Glycomyces paridis TaxID=2126555 RepID=A0A4S8PQX9_9ACTN|nr:phosphotransferase [Glycomyces paridis]THV30684.1 hypothetical protein E9998_04670 [Glycomyces paridis]